MKEFLRDYFSEEDIELLEKSQKARIDVQYYSDKNISKELYQKIKKQRALFLVKCKNILNHMNEETVKKLREKIKIYN